jgi:small subunit ribosomal protein S15
VVGAAEVRVPPSLTFGMREREKRMVFEHLPLLSADMSTRREMNALRRVKAEEMAAHHEGALAAGVEQANVMAALVDLRNANAAGIAFENRRRVIAAFSEPGKPNDTGRTEVQGVYFSCSPSTP